MTVILHVELFLNIIYYHTVIKPHPGTGVWGIITIFPTIKITGPRPTGGGTRESTCGLRGHSALCSQKRAGNFTFVGSTSSASPHPAPWAWRRSKNKSSQGWGWGVRVELQAPPSVGWGSFRSWQWTCLSTSLFQPAIQCFQQ